MMILVQVVFSRDSLFLLQDKWTLAHSTSCIFAQKLTEGFICNGFRIVVKSLVFCLNMPH